MFPCRVQVDDRDLLKLLELGLGETAAAKQLQVPVAAVAERVRIYLSFGILCCMGASGVIDWRAYGHWMRQQDHEQTVRV